MDLLYSRITTSWASKFVIELIVVTALTCGFASIADNWEEASYKKEYQKALARGYGADDISEGKSYYFFAIFFYFVYYTVWFLRIVHITKTNTVETLKYEFLDKLLFVASLPIILLITYLLIN